jgi:hypothetical protein
MEINGKQQLVVYTNDARVNTTTNKTSYYKGWQRKLITS